MTARPMTRQELLALPPTMSMDTLARCLGKSGPVIRTARRNGELAALGIKVNKLGGTYVVVTATVLDYLGVQPPAVRQPRAAKKGVA